MRLIAMVVLYSSFIAGAAWAGSNTGPLLISTPSDWKVDFDDSNGTEFYSLYPTNNGAVFEMMTITKEPRPMSDKDISDFLDRFSEVFVNQYNTSHDSRLKIEPKDCVRGNFHNDTSSGKYVKIKIGNGLETAVFLFSDGSVVWQGQYTGSAIGWSKAMEVLKSIEKNR